VQQKLVAIILVQKSGCGLDIECAIESIKHGKNQKVKGEKSFIIRRQVWSNSDSNWKNTRRLYPHLDAQ